MIQTVTVPAFLEFLVKALRGGSRAAGKSKIERFVIKYSILDVAAVLDPPLALPKTNHSKSANKGYL